MWSKALFLITVLTFLFIGSGFFTSAAAFDPFSSVCKRAPTSPTCQQDATQQSTGTNPAVKTIHTAANIIASVAGIASVMIIIYSGFMFVTAGGASPGQRGSDPNRIKTARSSLTGAIIGLVIIALAWTIVTFVTDRFIQ